MPLFETQEIQIDKETISRWNVLFAIPCYDQLISEPTVLSLVKTMMYFRDHGIKFGLCTITDSLISRARNNVVAKFMAYNQATHLMFIDADIAWEPDSIIKLLWHDKEVVTAAYPIKQIDWGKVQENVKAGVSKDLLLENSVRFVINPVKSSDNRMLKVSNGAIEIFDAGTGFMLIKREVIHEMIKKYPELKYNDDTNALNDEEKQWTYAFFNSYIDPHLNRFLSEDYGFCRYWQNMGGKIWVEPSIELTHIGRMKYKGTMMSFIEKHAKVVEEF